ncbi:MAG: hypothetical protein AAB494_02145 [Patescibacteria group bacterium]
MAKFEKRLEARKLRRKGRSIKSIAKRLDVSKGSVSVWCRDLKLTERQRNILMKKAIAAGHKGRMIGAEMNRQKRLESISYFKEKSLKDIGKLSKRELLVSGIALYWGEGSKGGKLSFANSDPALILFMIKWFKEIMGVKDEEFMPRIYINEIHKPREMKVLKFWAALLNLPASQFRKTIFIKTKQKKVYENYENYYGVLAFRVRNSAKLGYYILGLIDALKAQ